MPYYNCQMDIVYRRWKMSNSIVDVTLHVGKNTSHEQREDLRDSLMSQNGVAAASTHDKTPHLIIVEYDPEQVSSGQLIELAKRQGMRAELIGL